MSSFEHVRDSNLSRAWGRAFKLVMDSPKGACAPLLVSIDGFSGDLPSEDELIRVELEKALASQGKVRIDTTAMLVFPYKQWLACRPMSVADFSARCVSRLVPRLKHIDRRNKSGIYFERMMAFTAVSARGTVSTVDQLAEVIDRLSGERRFRQTGLQIACFDPGRDHTSAPRKGFPCLQQIGLSQGVDGDLRITGFYPAQYLFGRAYGNYLGLAHLSRYICDHADMTLSGIDCFVSNPILDSTKRELRELLAVVDARLEE